MNKKYVTIITLLLLTISLFGYVTQKRDTSNLSWNELTDQEKGDIGIKTSNSDQPIVSFHIADKDAIIAKTGETSEKAIPIPISKEEPVNINDNGPTVTIAQRLQIQNGMTTAEVTNILGKGKSMACTDCTDEDGKPFTSVTLQYTSTENPMDVVSYTFMN